MGLPVPKDIIEVARKDYENRSTGVLVHIMMFLVAAFTAGLVALGLMFFFGKNSVGWGVFSMLLMASLVIWYAGNHQVVKDGMSELESGLSKTVQALDQSVGAASVDYYFAGIGRGLAVCIDDQSIHILSDYKGGALPGTNGVVRKVKLPALTRVAAHYSEANKLTTLGTSTLAFRMDVNKLNKEALKDAATNTGLVFEINDIEFPSLFITTPFEAAKKWERILQQAGAGTLEKQEKPRHVM